MSNNLVTYTPLRNHHWCSFLLHLAVSYWPCPLSSRGICRWGPITVPARARWWALDQPPCGLPVSLMDLFLITGVPKGPNIIPAHSSLSHTPTPLPPSAHLCSLCLFCTYPITYILFLFRHFLVNCMVHIQCILYIPPERKSYYYYITYMLTFRPSLLNPKDYFMMSTSAFPLITPVPVMPFCIVFVVIFPWFLSISTVYKYTSFSLTVCSSVPWTFSFLNSSSVCSL